MMIPLYKMRFPLTWLNFFSSFTWILHNIWPFDEFNEHVSSHLALKAFFFFFLDLSSFSCFFWPPGTPSFILLFYYIQNNKLNLCLGMPFNFGFFLGSQTTSSHPLCWRFYSCASPSWQNVSFHLWKYPLHYQFLTFTRLKIPYSNSSSSSLFFLATKVVPFYFGTRLACLCNSNLQNNLHNFTKERSLYTL